jgi:L-threonylcarbamoyladenylate synthase
MKTKIFEISADPIANDEMDEIVDVLRNDGVIVYPTETYYGLGANGFSVKAIQDVFRLKKRESSKPLSIIISDISMLDPIVSDIPPLFPPLIAEFWPGPLTIILKASPKIPVEMQEEGTIGVRLTGHNWVRSLVSRARFPITATSANISGEKEISTASEAKKMFLGKVDLIVDGGRTPGMAPSTIVDLSKGMPRLIREGRISARELKDILPSLSESTS